MHERIISRSVDWIRENVADGMTSQQIAEKARASDLPDETKEELAELPDGQHSQDEVIAWVQEALLGRLGSADMAMRGFGGSM